MLCYQKMPPLCLVAIMVLLSGTGCAPGRNGGDSARSEINTILRPQGQDICLDVKTGKMWQVKRGGPYSTYEEARQYAENLQLAGYDDWRLPTQKELLDLHNMFFWKKNGECTMRHSGDYWNTNGHGESKAGHWEAYYLCGPEVKYVETQRSKAYVRVVRP